MRYRDINCARRLVEVFDPTWSGCWITDRGDVLEVDHASDVHHIELAMDRYARYLDLSEFGVEDDDEDPLENDYVRDYVADLALHDGWVRVMVRGDQVGIQLATTTAKAKAALRRYIRGLSASTYTFENAERTASEMFHTNGEAMRYIARLPERPPELD